MSRTEYLLGPGDVVDVSIFGDLNHLYRVPVTPEGSVVIPTVGIVRVLGLNLTEAEKRVREMAYRVYRNVDVRLTLSQVRPIKVFVVGSVPTPGVHVASSATRISEVVPSVENGIVRRNVLLRRSSGDTLAVDLIRFRQTGDLRSNPTLREGDAIIVPRIAETLEVYGGVTFPGTYEYRKGESLAAFLSVANGNGGFPPDAADSVRLTRFVGSEEREFYVFSREEALGLRGQQMLLEPFDAISVARFANFKRHKTAGVYGQVMRPGIYPIRPDTTTVCQLIDLAGGFTRDASLIATTLRRSPGGAEAQGLRTLSNLPDSLLTRDELRILQVRAHGDESNVVVDFEKGCAEGSDAYRQTLEPGDSLSIPRRKDEITVLGAVTRPGIVQHVAGRPVDYFVAQAGGYSHRADQKDVTVLKAKLGTPIDVRDVKSVEPGDMIIVPFEERRGFIETLQAVNAVVTPIVTLVFTVLAVTGRLGL